MRTILMLVSILSLISMLSSCSNMMGNVVPKKGPTMEQVYDGMDGEMTTPPIERHPEPMQFHHERVSVMTSDIPRNAVDTQFHKLANPELKLYVFPHLSGKDEVPVPGYFTAFNAYDHDHYALPNEMVRG